MKTDNKETEQCTIPSVISRFVNIKLKREIVEGMISTYEFLVWSNTGDERKDCKKILTSLKKSLL